MLPYVPAPQFIYFKLTPFVHLPQVDNSRNSWMIFILSSVLTLPSLDHIQHEKEIYVQLCLWIITGMCLASQTFFPMLPLPLPSHPCQLPHTYIFKNNKELLAVLRLVGKSWQERRGLIFVPLTSEYYCKIQKITDTRNLLSFKLKATQSQSLRTPTATVISSWFWSFFSCSELFNWFWVRTQLSDVIKSKCSRFSEFHKDFLTFPVVLFLTENLTWDKTVSSGWYFLFLSSPVWQCVVSGRKIPVGRSRN